MKKLLFILAFVPMVYSCTKEADTGVETPKPKMLVTVEVTSPDPSLLMIPAIGSESFQGTYKKSFAPTGHVIRVNIHSNVPSVKTIKIYANGELVAQRSGNCEGTDYELTYDLNQY